MEKSQYIEQKVLPKTLVKVLGKELHTKIHSIVSMVNFGWLFIAVAIGNLCLPFFQKS